MADPMEVARRAGLNPELMEEATAGLQDLGPVRAQMAAVEMMRASTVEFCDPWLDALLDNYAEAFGRPHARDARGK